MVVSALSFLTGLMLVQQLSILPDIKWLMVIGLVAGIIAWLRYWRCLFFVVGIVWAIVFAMYRLSDRLPEQLEGVDIQVAGVIADLPEQDEKHVRFDFIAREGVYAKSQSGTGLAIAREGVYAAGQPRAGAAIVTNSILPLPAKLRLSCYYPNHC